MGNTMVSLKRSRGNLFDQKLAKVELENGNHLLPKNLSRALYLQEVECTMGGCITDQASWKECGFHHYARSTQETMATQWGL